MMLIFIKNNNKKKNKKNKTKENEKYLSGIIVDGYGWTKG